MLPLQAKQQLGTHSQEKVLGSQVQGVWNRIVGHFRNKKKEGWEHEGYILILKYLFPEAEHIKGDDEKMKLWLFTECQFWLDRVKDFVDWCEA